MFSEKLIRVLYSLFSANEGDADCDECFSEMDRFADLYQAGKDPAASLPRIATHLNHCHDCNEEYQGLLSVLRQLDDDTTSPFDGWPGHGL